MLKQFSALLPLFVLGMISCQSKPASTDKKATDTVASQQPGSPDVVAKLATGPVDNAAVMARKQVPIVCYHQIRDWKATDSKGAKDYIVQIAAFKEHIKMLADSGYHTILPNQLYNYLTTGAALPKKPIMLTFDDTDLDQFTVAAPELKKYGFKAVYFVMTVSIGRPRYMTAEMVKKLSDDGNVIASHTWDHHRVDKYTHNGVFQIKGKNGKITNRPVDDWVTQIDKPTKKLQEITGKEIVYFAYPFGIWKKPVLPEIQKRGFKLAFQLADKRDPDYPLLTVRRILDSGYWSTKTFSNSVRNSF
ncbi:polysaccharide deacetylase family protein [Mucilaginibacter sp. ZT4R22]|uniref:Polysaccharide deacetylase family protein n=1 Tax=Mucilaginibacter pankratovii TaxID=2772110 RepID=A0ABR7WWE6_9SPHI|nr:polysaccharide deacetylase family protein [Mucilaginibacter pankratovii]MBD1366620.1 polysaccharide deacetylase family protein [Mucilaginibacter pankratovii]